MRGSSVMPGQRRDIERQLEQLPESFTAEKIREMHQQLSADVSKLKDTDMPRKEVEARLHAKHKTLAYSYPTLFFKTVRGEMDNHILDTLMELKRQVDEGQITSKRAKELVIDGAKRHVEGEAPRAPRPEKAPGGTVQEITLNCKVEDS